MYQIKWLCHECARELNLWKEWSSENSPYNHANTVPCCNCHKITFTVKVKQEETRNDKG